MAKLIGLLNDSEFAALHRAVIYVNDGTYMLERLLQLLEYAEAINCYNIDSPSVLELPDNGFSPSIGICCNVDLFQGWAFGHIYLKYANEPMNKPHWWNNWGKWFRFKGNPDYPVGNGSSEYTDGLNTNTMYVGDYGYKRIQYLKWLIEVFKEFIALEKSNAQLLDTTESTEDSTESNS